MQNYKVALVLDSSYYHHVAEEIKTLTEVYPIDTSLTLDTPDNQYISLIWDSVPWDIPEAMPLREKLKSLRHALITIDEDFSIERDVKPSDQWGIDEVFEDILTLECNFSLCA